MIKILVILNDQPYGSERPFNALRLAGALAKREQVELRVFLLGDTVACAIATGPGRALSPRPHAQAAHPARRGRLLRHMHGRPRTQTRAVRRGRAAIDARGADRLDVVSGQDACVLSVRDGVSERAARYDAWFATPLGRAMDAAEARAVLELAEPEPGERALDAGCGTGIYTRRLAERGAIVTGVDRDPEMLAAATLKAPSAMFVEGEVTALPFAEDSFDLSVAVTLLCFVEDPLRAVAELVRVTRPGGRVVLAELGRYSVWAAWRRIKGWQGSDAWAGAHFFTPRALAALLRQAGASDLQTAAAAYLPPGAPAWLRSRAAGYERRARRLGGVGAAFVLARGEVGARWALPPQRAVLGV